MFQLVVRIVCLTSTSFSNSNLYVHCEAKNCTVSVLHFKLCSTLIIFLICTLCLNEFATKWTDKCAVVRAVMKSLQVVLLKLCCTVFKKLNIGAMMLTSYMNMCVSLCLHHLL